MIVGILGPVPVWLVASVAAFFTESFLIGPNEIAVPGEKETLESEVRVSDEVAKPAPRGVVTN